MNPRTLVRQVMTVDPVSVPVTARVSEVRELLRRCAFHHVPVTSEGRLVGILSGADLAGYALDAWVPDTATADAHLDATLELGNIMTHDPDTIRPDATVRQAAEALVLGQYHSLPVVDGDGRLVGIVTSTDLLRLLTLR